MHIIGVVLDSDRVRAALYNEEYRPLAVKEAACACSCEDGVIADAAALCDALMADGGVQKTQVAYIGAAVPAAWGCPCGVAAQLEKKTGIKTLAESAINAAALGEAYLADVSSITVLRIGNTVECGIVIDGTVYPAIGHRGGAVAHTVITMDGYECSCGRRGCFEAYVSDAGLRRIAADAGVEGAQDITPAALYAMDTPAAEEAKQVYVRRLADGITNVINIFQTHEMVLEGEFTKVGAPLMEPLMEIILRDQFTHLSPNKCTVRFANTAADTRLVGAALIGR